MNLIGRRILTYDSVGSTNELAKQEAERGAEEGLVIVAKTQTDGRGRRGRGWVSRPGLGAYMSVVLRPVAPDAAFIAILGGVAAAEVIDDLGADGVSIKWPNDVLVNGRKIAGVLVEPRMGTNGVEFAVLGIGVNVRHGEADWPPELENTATSLLREGVDVSCDDVIGALLKKLDDHYAKRDSLLETWTKWSGTSRVPVID